MTYRDDTHVCKNGLWSAATAAALVSPVVNQLAKQFYHDETFGWPMSLSISPCLSILIYLSVYSSVFLSIIPRYVIYLSMSVCLACIAYYIYAVVFYYIHLKPTPIRLYERLYAAILL